MTVLGAANAGGSGHMAPPPLYTTAGLTDVLTRTGFAMLLAAVFGITVSAGEFRHGTATATYLATPDRVRVLTVKALVAAGVGLLFGLVAAGVTTGVGLAFAAAKGYEARGRNGTAPVRAGGGAGGGRRGADLGCGRANHRSTRHLVAALLGGAARYCRGTCRRTEEGHHDERPNPRAATDRPLGGDPGGRRTPGGGGCGERRAEPGRGLRAGRDRPGGRGGGRQEGRPLLPGVPGHGDLGGDHRLRSGGGPGLEHRAVDLARPVFEGRPDRGALRLRRPHHVHGRDRDRDALPARAADRRRADRVQDRAEERVARPRPARRYVDLTQGPVAGQVTMPCSNVDRTVPPPMALTSDVGNPSAPPAPPWSR